MSAVAAFPGLSQLLAWPTEHLTQAADHWEAVGGRSYGAAHQVWRDALTIDWQGEAADALRTATHADMITTSAVADQLQTAAKIARGGASDLYAARSRVRYAVEDAHTAGFDVGEDTSVIDRSAGGSAAQRAARQAEAEALGAVIRQRAAQLVALDQQVAGKVTAAVAGIRDTFPRSPTPETPPRKSNIQTVDNHTFKQDPVPPPGPSADPPWENLPSPRTLEDVRDALRQLRRANTRPHRELDTPEEMREFYKWLTGGSVRTVPPFEFPRRMLPDGTVIEMRPDSGSGGPVIELKPPGAKEGPKIHLPLAPFINDPPELPGIGDHSPTELPPAPGHPLPTPLLPPQFADPADLPPWLQNPSPPGFSVSPIQPPVFGWDQPDAPASPVPHPAPPAPGGQSWLPEVGHDLSEGGKKVFGWVVVGGVLVWTILSGGGQGGEAAVP